MISPSLDLIMLLKSGWKGTSDSTVLQSVHYEGQGFQGSPRPTSVLLCAAVALCPNLQLLCPVPPQRTSLLSPTRLLRVPEALSTSSSYSQDGPVHHFHRSQLLPLHKAGKSTRDKSQTILNLHFKLCFSECKCPQQKKPHLKLKVRSKQN